MISVRPLLADPTCYQVYPNIFSNEATDTSTNKVGSGILGSLRYGIVQANARHGPGADYGNPAPTTLLRPKPTPEK